MLYQNLRKMPRFLFAGTLATTAHYAILFGLFNGLNTELVLATSFGAVAGATVNYYINYFYTFNSQRRHWRALRSFIVVVTTGIILNALIVGLTFHLLAFPALFSQVIATLITFGWNYEAHRRWTF